MKHAFNLCLSTDFDGDDKLSRNDMHLLLATITKNQLSSEEINFITDKVSWIVFFVVHVDRSL
jgi:hypothetical protein